MDYSEIFKDNVEEEINFIKDLKSQIQTDKRKKMVITQIIPL